MQEINNYNYGDEPTYLEGFYQTPDPLHLESAVPSMNQVYVPSMNQVYSLGKASFVGRVIEYLQFMHATRAWSVEFMTIINRFDGWIIRVKLNASWPPDARLYLKDFIREMGELYQPIPLIQNVLDALEGGESILAVMHRYHISVVDHGQPRTDEMEVFCEYVMHGLGYCPETLT